MPAPSDDAVILEFTQIGGSVKVTALDPVSLREVTVIGPASASKDDLTRLALRKLHYMSRRDKKPHG